MKIKTKPSRTEMLHRSMIDLANHLNRPEHYADDLLVHDLDVLKKYPESDFVWVLRTNGTHLFPLCTGVDPSWLERVAKDKENYCFHIRPTHGNSISKISNDQAINLINELPMKSMPLQVDQLKKKVSAVLSHCHFGVFVQPQISTDDWGAWYEYFRINNLSLMAHFMRRAIHHRDSLLAR